jgi:hypothetical protein
MATLTGTRIAGAAALFLAAWGRGAGFMPAPTRIAGAAALFLASLLAYFPALQGDPLWDDDRHLTPPELRSLAALVRIWTDLGATQQFYPLLHSAFWLEHRLWSDAMTGYHLATVGQHALAALLLALVLRRLAVPGAWLAAWLFALHPIHVESVASISEQKNTLSAVVYLGAALAYLQFDTDRRPARYRLALLLYGLGLTTKTVVAVLPTALLFVFWWQRGWLRWRADGSSQRGQIERTESALGFGVTAVESIQTFFAAIHSVVRQWQRKHSMKNQFQCAPAMDSDPDRPRRRRLRSGRLVVGHGSGTPRRSRPGQVRGRVRVS